MSLPEAASWYEQRFAVEFGDDEIGRLGLAVSIATWTAPIFAAFFIISDALENLFAGLVGYGDDDQVS